MPSGTRFRLRYRGEDIPLEVGDFRIGRASDCQLVLDDNHVSRWHAVIRVKPDQLLLEDLGSRNGVLLNGDPIERAVRLRHADWIMIGSSVFAVVESRAPSSEMSRARTAASGRITFRPEGRTRPVSPQENVSTSRGSFYDILLNGATAALDMENRAEAEGNFENLVLVLKTRALRGERPEESTMGSIFDVGLRLVGVTGNMDWIGRAFDALGATHSVPSPDQVEQLARLTISCGSTPAAAIDAYLERMVEKPDVNEDQRSVLARLEDLSNER